MIILQQDHLPNVCCS